MTNCIKKLEKNIAYVLYTDVSKLDLRLAERLPDFRKKKFDAYVFEKDKRLSLGAWLLVMRGLGSKAAEQVRYTQFEKPYVPGHEVQFNISHSGRFAMCAFAQFEVGCDIEQMKPYDGSLARVCMQDAEMSKILGCVKSTKTFEPQIATAEVRIKTAKAQVVATKVCTTSANAQVAATKACTTSANAQVGVMNAQPEKANEQSETVEAQSREFYRFWTLKESFMKATAKGLNLAPKSFAINGVSDYVDIAGGNLYIAGENASIANTAIMNATSAACGETFMDDLHTLRTVDCEKSLQVVGVASAQDYTFAEFCIDEGYCSSICGKIPKFQVVLEEVSF